MNALPTDVRSDKNIVVVPMCFERFTWGFHSLLYSQPGLIVSENSLKGNDSELLKKTGVWKSVCETENPAFFHLAWLQCVAGFQIAQIWFLWRETSSMTSGHFCSRKTLPSHFPRECVFAVFSFFFSSSFYPFSYYSEKIFKA